MTTRRNFLTTAGLAAASAPSLLYAQSSQKRPVLGKDEHTYECIHDWLQVPDHIRFGDTHGVTQDSDGRIYIAHTVNPSSESADAVAVFDDEGKFIKSWGEAFRGGAHGLDIRQEGHEQFLYHCDVGRRLVVKSNLEGEVLWEKSIPEEAADHYAGDKPFIPTNVAFAPNGDFYVADGYGSNFVHQYDIEGNYKRTFGGAGDGEGQLQQPHGIWVDTRSAPARLVVADRANNRLQYFTLDGEHLSFVHDEAGIRQPCHFDLRHDLMLIPDLSSQVTILNGRNEVVARLGDGHPTELRGAPREDFVPGKFVHPHDAIFTRDGDIIVAEWVPIGRVTLLRKVS